jgi:CubicO group peptidase (beta-lactamase class C family)
MRISMHLPLTCVVAVCLIVILGDSVDASHAHGDFFSSHANAASRGPLTLDQLPAGWEQQVDEFIGSLTECQGIIGLTVSIVVANTSVYAKGFGVTSLADPQPVDADTLFSIGSTSKAFTSTLLGMLIDEGLFAPLGWDTLVTSIAKDFSFYSPLESAHMTIRDLLAMKTGLSLHPLMMFKNDTRKNLLYEFQYAAPAWEMRTNFQYHNWMIHLAGHLAEIVTGQSWESLIQERILGPLGMNTSTPYLADVVASSNWAKPYALNLTSLEWEALPETINEYLQNLAPAASMSTTANDAAAWLMVHLNHGFSPSLNKSIVSAQSVDQCHAPQFLAQVMPFTSTLPTGKFSNANLGYGFGWIKDSYQGHEGTANCDFLCGSESARVVARH